MPLHRDIPMMLEETSTQQIKMDTSLSMTTPSEGNRKDQERSTNLSTSEFSYVVTTRAFVDKTPLIRAVFSAPDVVLITMPRRFGKSTNLNMLRRFLEIQVDENGKREDIKITSNYKLFKDNENRLEICKDEEFFDQHFGKYPVMCIDFQSLQGLTSYDTMLAELRAILCKTFLHHRYLFHVENLWVDDLDIDKFTNYVHSKRNKSLTESCIKEGFQFLSKVLHRYFKTEVFVLIDECDSPVSALIMNDIEDCKKSVPKIVTFLHGIVSDLLESNPYVNRAYLTACVSYSGTGFLPSNVIHYAFICDNPFSKFSGLTKKHVEKLLKTFNMETQAELQKWYNGFKIIGQNIEIYSICSVLHYLNKKQAAYYWVDSDVVQAFKQAFRVSAIRIKIEELLNNKRVLIKCEPLDIEGIIYLNGLLLSPEQAKEPQADLCLQFLYECGYLTADDNNFPDKDTLSVKIPNEELKIYFKSAIRSMDIYAEKYHFKSEDVEMYYSALDRLSTKAEEYEFNGFVLAVRKLFSAGTAVHDSAAHFHAILYVYTVNRYSTTYVKGRKRLDLLIFREYDRATLVIEVKYKESSEIALQEILNREYFEIFNHHKGSPATVPIFMGLNVDRYRNVSLSYLINDTDISHALHVRNEYNSV